MSNQETQPGRLTRHVCAFCGDTFYSVRSDAKFCGPKHRQAHARWRGKLARLRERVKRCVNEMADYLDYDTAKPAAAQHLKNVVRQVEAEMVMHGIMEVK